MEQKHPYFYLGVAITFICTVIALIFWLLYPKTNILIIPIFFNIGQLYGFLLMRKWKDK